MVIIPAREKTTDSASLEWSTRYDRRLLDRLIFFSDGVFAIAITILVLNLTVPIIAPGAVGTELPSALRALEPKLLSYALSFFVIGIYWIAHQRAFIYVERYDRGLAWINLAFLLFVVLIPFATALLGAYSDQLIVVVLYAVVLTSTGLVLSVLWYFISYHHQLLAKDASKRYIRANMVRFLSTPILFLASIGVAFVSVPAAMAIWYLTIVINLVIGARTHTI